MRKSLRPGGLLAAVLSSLAIAVSACGSSSTAAPAASPTPTAAPATIAVATNATLGPILVDGSGRTIYLFVSDTGTTSACYTSCATAWPPVLTHGPPQAGSGVTASLLGTTSRTDGTTEVTYGGHPLYYFIGDKKPGDTTGQSLNNFGGLWFAVKPDGNRAG